MERAIRGIRILRRRENRFQSIKLLSINDKVYAVTLRKSILGFTLVRRRYEFKNPDEAQIFYDRAVDRHFGKPKSKQSPLW